MSLQMCFVFKRRSAVAIPSPEGHIFGGQLSDSNAFTRVNAHESTDALSCNVHTSRSSKPFAETKHVMRIICKDEIILGISCKRNPSDSKYSLRVIFNERILTNTCSSCKQCHYYA